MASNFLKRAMIPWASILSLGLALVFIGVMMILGLMGPDAVTGVIIILTGSIFTAMGSYLLGRISSFISIQKQSEKHRSEIKSNPAS